MSKVQNFNLNKALKGHFLFIDTQSYKDGLQVLYSYIEDLEHVLTHHYDLDEGIKDSVNQQIQMIVLAIDAFERGLALKLVEALNVKGSKK